MLRAVPLTLCIAASSEKQFRSGILILAISSTCFSQAGSGEHADVAVVERRERPARRASLWRKQNARRLAARSGIR